MATTTTARTVPLLASVLSPFRTLLGTILVILACAAPSVAVQAETKKPTEIEKLAAELQADMAKLAEKNAAVLNDPWLRCAKAHFDMAEQASTSLLVDSKPNGPSINDFHYGLSRFVLGLDQFPTWTPVTSAWGEVKAMRRPPHKDLVPLSKAAKAIQDKANRCLPLQATEKFVLSESTTTVEFVDYGSRVLVIVDRLLGERTLEQLTTMEKEQTTALMQPSLDALKAALSKLNVDREVPQHPPSGNSLIDQDKSSVKRCIADVRKACASLVEKNPASLDRVDPVKVELDSFEANLGRFNGMGTPKKL